MSDTPRTDEVLRSIDRTGTIGESWRQEASNLETLSRVLERENAALRKDAARYRWLRGPKFKGEIVCPESQFAANAMRAEFLSHNRLDAAIDAAMGDMSGTEK